MKTIIMDYHEYLKELEEAVEEAANDNFKRGIRSGIFFLLDHLYAVHKKEQNAIDVFWEELAQDLNEDQKTKAAEILKKL